MKWNDLPKQKQLLIFMLNREASTSIPFTIAHCGDEVVANGISANKNALANMLRMLYQKKQIEKVHFQNGTFGYLLSKNGQDEAEYWMNQCDSDMEVPESIDSLRKTEENCHAIEAYAKRLEQIITGCKDELFKLNDQPKQSNKLVKAQAKEIERLKIQIENLEAENDNLRVFEKMTRDAALYFDEEKTKLQKERDSLYNSLYNLSEENVKLTMKATARVTALKKSLASAMADLDEKNKKIEHLEDSIDKLKCSLTKMAEWAEQMKNGSN